MGYFKLIVVAVAIILTSCMCAPDNCESAGIQPDSLNSELGDGFVILTWEAFPSRRCIDRYQISVFLNDEELQLLKNLDLNQSDARGVVVGELKNGLNYLFVITAFNQFGSGLARIEGVPGQMEGGQVVAQGGQLVEDSAEATVVDENAVVVPSPVPSPSPKPKPSPQPKKSPSPPPSPSPSPVPVKSPKPKQNKSPKPEPTPTPTPTPTPAPTPAPKPAPIVVPAVQSSAKVEVMSEVTASGLVPSQPSFVSARCAINKCCVKWRKSLLEDVPADYFVVGKEYRAGDAQFITRGSETIDYAAGVVFAEKFPADTYTASACVEFKGLEEDNFYRFQVIGANENGFGEASRWSIAGKTRRSTFLRTSSFIDDCGCGVKSIAAPQGFDLEMLKKQFPQKF